VAGAEATGRFWFKLFPKKFRVRDFELSDALLEKLVGSVEPGGQGELLARFLRINGELRRQNNQTLADLRLKTEEKILWQGPFEHWGKEESYFADGHGRRRPGEPARMVGCALDPGPHP
jgi:hypothetical protein